MKQVAALQQGTFSKCLLVKRIGYPLFMLIVQVIFDCDPSYQVQ